jgi:hypothetical protein
MKTKNLTPTVTTVTNSVVPNSPPAVPSGFTLGLDLGDRTHHVCVLDPGSRLAAF